MDTLTLFQSEKDYKRIVSYISRHLIKFGYKRAQIHFIPTATPPEGD